MTITEFLLARIAEDEALASGEPHSDEPREGIAWCEVGAISDVLMISPNRVLAECKAKRRIVELHRPQLEHVEWFDAPGVGKTEVCSSCHPAEPTEWNPPVGQAGVRPDGFVASYVLSPCPTLRALALPYADHPDYDPSWRI